MPRDLGASPLVEGGLEGIEPILVEPIPKPAGGHRSLVRLGPSDARRYAASVLAVLPAVERVLQPTVFTDRATAGTIGGSALEGWPSARARYRRALAGVATGTGRACFIGDVADCYGSIRPQVVGGALRSMGVDPDPAGRVERLLDSFADRGVRGIPSGPRASAVLANAVLASVDEAVSHAAEAAVFRWVDDVVVVAPGRRGAVAAASAYARSLRTIGLQPNPTKTCVVDDLGAFLNPTSSASAAPSSARGMMRAP